MSKKKIENMTKEEIEDAIKELKEARTMRVAKEKQSRRKEMAHRKILLGGTVYSVLKDAGIDVMDLKEEELKASLAEWEKYLVKYYFNIVKIFKPTSDETSNMTEDEDMNKLFDDNFSAGEEPEKTEN